jgi:hypothetical protein
MRPRRCQLPLGTGPSLTRRDPVDLEGREDPVDQGQVVLGPVVRDPVDPGLAVLDPVDLAVLDPVDLAVLHLEDLAVPAHTRDPVGLDPVARVDLDPVDLAGQVDPAVLHPVDLAVPADIRGRVDPVGLEDLAGRADPVDQGMNRVDRADPAGLDLTGRADLADQGMNRADPVGPADLVGLADLVDRHRRRTRLEVLSTAVAPRWAARGMSRTVSAHPVTVHRLRPHSAGGVGMAGLHPERRRLGGMDRRPRVAGTVHRLPVAGTPHGTGRRATLR